MTPGKYALAIYRGDSYTWTFKLWADTGKTVPVNLTGVVPKAEIRDKSGGAILGTLTCVVTIPNIIDASLAADDSALLKSGVWDLQLTYASGAVATVLGGAVTVTADVTDSTVVTTARAERLRSVK